MQAIDARLVAGQSVGEAYSKTIGETAVIVSPYFGPPILAYMAGNSMYQGNWEQAGAATTGLGMQLWAWRQHIKEFGWKRPFVWSRSPKITPQNKAISDELITGEDCSVRVSRAKHEFGMEGKSIFIEPPIGQKGLGMRKKIIVPNCQSHLANGCISTNHLSSSGRREMYDSYSCISVFDSLAPEGY